MAAKLKGNFFLFPRVALNINITDRSDLVGVKKKNSVNFVGMLSLSFRGGKEIQEVVRARLGHSFTSFID